MTFVQAILCAAFIGISGFLGNSAQALVLEFSDEERAAIEGHGPWPTTNLVDPSNRASGNVHAIELGRRLFFDEALSIDGTMSCATCHDPNTGLSDGHETGIGRAHLPRNTPALFNLAFARWFGWGGGADSLWAQSIRPILATDEMAATPQHVTNHIRQTPTLNCLYQKVFGSSPSAEKAETGLVNTAKALASFQETLLTGLTAFDRFRDALQANDLETAAAYPEDAQRGLKIFVGKGRCSLCHFGAPFSNSEFGDIGIPFFLGHGKVDKGRYGGIQKLRASPYSLTGTYSDAPSRQGATKTRHIRLQDRNWGEFKIPSLRNVALTAPYMHNGSLKSLSDVVRHYSEIDEERLHVDGEKILKPLRLSEREQADLVAFLGSLTAPLIQPLTAPSTEQTCSPGR